MAKNSIGIADIANKVGLSRTTVSYVLNGRSKQMKIAARTSAQIVEVAKELGYTPNYWAKSLVRKSSQMIGVLFPDISGSCAHQITEGMQEALHLTDYELVLAVSFWDPDKEKREIEMMLEKRVEGIIALPQIEGKDSFQFLRNANCPLVFICDWLDDIEASSVALDTQDAIFKLLSHLCDQGCSKIQMISVDYKSLTLIEREKAFLEGLKRLGLQGSENSIHRTKLADELSVHETIRMLAHTEDSPDGIICVSDPVAMSVLSELARLGVSVPEEMAVASIGNLQYTDHPFFSLTTVDECRREIGRQAVSLLMEQIGSKKQFHKQIRIKGPLITRGSTVGSNRNSKLLF